MENYTEPEWTAENMNRKQGGTTFKICGWCAYAGCGSCRYDCHLNSYCDLMKDYGEKRKVNWDTPCKVMQLGDIDRKSIIQSKEYTIESLRKQIQDKVLEIGVLKKIKLKNKPPLPDNRIEDFPLKSVVYVFYENKWNRGIVVSGYRSGDGCVSYVLDDYPNSKKGWGCGVSVPCVLHEWEYKYFKTNLVEFKQWLRDCDREYNGKKLPLESYYNAMVNNS